MGVTYIVSGHLGGIFLSKGDPEDIEAVCERCGDYDRIDAKYEDGDVDGAVDALTSVYAYYTWIDTDYYPEDTDEDIEDKHEWIIDAYDRDDMLEWAQNIKGFVYTPDAHKWVKLALPEGAAERFAAQSTALAEQVCAELDENIRKGRKES